MQKAPPSAGETLHGVANARGESLVHSGPKCVHCGKPIPRPRPGQRFCSATCRGAMWRAQHRGQAAAERVRKEEIRALLEAALEKLQEGMP